MSYLHKTTTWLVIPGLAVIAILLGAFVAGSLRPVEPARSTPESPTPAVPPVVEALPASQTSGYPVVRRDGSDEYESPFVAVVETFQNAVVNVSARSSNQETPWWFRDRDRGASSGSGFFFRPDGYVLTNAHVVRDATRLTVRTASGYEYDARLVGADPMTDLAVLKVEPEEEIVTIPFGTSDDLKVGDWAIAIGNPFPQQGLDRTVTVGVISATGRSNLRFGSETPRYQNYIQTDASINPGNSGGPLLNLRGEAIGVNSAISSPTGSSVGIGFAIPIDMAKAIVPDLIEFGQAQRGWLGVWLSNVTEREAKRQRLTQVAGVRIDSVMANSPASVAGIRRGDVVVNFNGQDVRNSNQFSVLVSTVKVGEAVPIGVLRNGQEVALEAVVGDQNNTAQIARSESGSNRDVTEERWLGMELVEFTTQLASEIGVKHIDGIYVNGVDPGSTAYRAGVTEGTIVIQLNNQVIGSLGEARRVIGQLGTSPDAVPLLVLEPDGSVARKVLRP